MNGRQTCLTQCEAPLPFLVTEPFEKTRNFPDVVNPVFSIEIGLLGAFGRRASLPPMIISCGEALIDFLPTKTGETGPAFLARTGGSLFNVAIAIGRLGSPAGFYGGLSSDLFGEMLKAALAASSVDASFATLTDRPTTLAFVTFSGSDARYAFFDEGSAGRMLSEADLPAFPKTVSALHFGSFSLAEEPCGSTLEALMRREFADRVISLDLNIRPTLIRNRDGYLARIERLIAMSDIIKLSSEDLDWLGETADAVAARWLKHSGKLVLVTRGAEGATAATARGRIDVAARRVKVADTVGAGDTFSAGFLSALEKRGLLTKAAVAKLDDAALSAALDFAARAAAITVSRPGADPPWLHELE